MKIPIYYTEKCKTFINIPNCDDHNTTDLTSIKCNFCAAGYVKALDSFTCIQIPVAENCAKKDTPTGSCLMCNSGFYLVKSGTTYSCLAIPPHISTNCSSYSQSLNINTLWSSSTHGTTNCSVCQGGFIGVSADYCLARTSIPYLTAATVNAACIQMDQNGVCIKCASDSYLKADNTCAACTDAKFWIDGTKINTCATAAGVLVAAKKTDGTTVMNLSCKSDYLTVLKSDGMGTNVNWWKTEIAFNSADLPNTAPIYNIADRQQEVTCTTYNTADSYTLNGTLKSTVTGQGITKDTRTVVQNTTGTVYVTVSCGWLKKGWLTANTTHKYVNCQADNDTNFSADRLAGVPLNWSNLFNVHKCTNASSIPVFVGKLTDGNFASIDTHAFTLGDANKPVIFCLDVSTIASLRTGLSLDANIPD